MPKRKAKTTPSSVKFIQLAHGWKFCNKCDDWFQRNDHLQRHLKSERHYLAELETRNQPDLLFPVPDVVTELGCSRSYVLSAKLQARIAKAPTPTGNASVVCNEHQSETGPSDRAQVSPQHAYEPQDDPGVGPKLPELPAHLRGIPDHRDKEAPLSWEVEDNAEGDHTSDAAWDAADVDDVYAVGTYFPFLFVPVECVCGVAVEVSAAHSLRGCSDRSLPLHPVLISGRHLVYGGMGYRK